MKDHLNVKKIKAKVRLQKKEPLKSAIFKTKTKTETTKKRVARRVTKKTLKTMPHRLEANIQQIRAVTKRRYPWSSIGLKLASCTK